MALKEVSRGKKLGAEYLNTVTVKISYVGGGEERVAIRQCHFYVVGEAIVDLFEVMLGRLEKSASFNNVYSVEEIEGE
jgi:hypothetical protein